MCVILHKLCNNFAHRYYAIVGQGVISTSYSMNYDVVGITLCFLSLFLNRVFSLYLISGQ